MVKAGQKLAEERRSKGLTLTEVSNATKIKEEFLRAIERSEYEALPSPSYAQGFVRTYARFLNLPDKDTLALFRRDFAGDKNFEVLPKSLAGRKTVPLRKFRIRQIFVLGFFAILILLGYIFFQYRYAFLNPPLDLTSPKEAENISSSTITVAGKTTPNATVYVEDEAVVVDENGNFKKEIVGFPGETTITVKAVSRFGKETTLRRKVEVK